MTDCTCTDIKQIIVCELNRGDGPCLTPASPETATTPTVSEPAGTPPALNSDALTNSLTAALRGAETVTEL